MSEWKEYKLEEIIERFIDYRGKTPRKVISGIPLITAKVVKNGRLMPSNEFIAEEDYHSWMTRGFPEINDIVLTTEAPLGEVALIKDKNVALAQRIITLRGKERVVDNIFLKYYLQSPRGQNELQSRASGTTVMGIKAELLKKIPVFIPPIEEQKRIAGVLSSLDDKIDLLNRENATLEALAETLFRHYFIENPNPDWKEGKVSDIAIHCKDSINPQKHSDEFFLHYSIPAYDNGKHPTAEQGRNIQSNKYVIPQKCILFSKLNPHKDKRVWLMLDDVQPNAICSTEFQIVKPQNDQWLYFLYEWLTYKENYDEIASGVSGTSGSHQRIDPKAIFDNECLIVDDGILAQYNEQVIPIFRKVESNQQQMQTMVAKRDTLLPRIMSGEVKVTEH